VTELRDRLRDDPLPGEADAAERSWALVEAALAERTPVRRRRHPVARLALAAALVCAGLVAALSPAGAWIGDRFESEPKRDAVPAFAALPKGGSVLALTRTGAYAIRPDGGNRRLGAFSDAGWSPHGIHVVGADGRRLTAVTPRGATIKWTLARPGRVHDPVWSTDLGFAVAYLEGSTLRAVAGTGDPDTDRRLRRGAAAVTPAWRPRSDRVLAYATAAGGVEALDIDSGRTLWRVAAPPALALAWTGDARRVVALSPHSVTVLDATGHVERTIELPGAARDFAVHPARAEAAVVISGQGGTRVLAVPLDGGKPRRLFQGGDVDGLAWSADGRRLLLGWRGADEWLLLGPGKQIRSLHGVSRELGARGGFPRVAGWCCAG
jgi:hypothetical protein